MPTRSRAKSNCGVCLQKIIEGKEEAIFCEGKCQQWYHRGCASVPRELFATLTTSNVPFHCLTCNNSTLQQEVADLTLEIRRIQETLSIIPKLQTENAALTKEVAELREKLAAQSNQSKTTLTASAATSSATAVSKPSIPQSGYLRSTRTEDSKRSGNRSRRPLKRSANRVSQLGTQSASRQQTKRNSHGSLQGQPRKPLVPIKDARKVWKTFKFVTASAVSHAVHSITGIPTSELSVKRKYRQGGENNTSTWWFVIRGKEEVLEKLDSLWPQVQLQTSWELNHALLAYSDLNSESEGQPPTNSNTNSKADDVNVTSQVGTSPGDDSLSTSFCQTQTQIPVT